MKILFSAPLKSVQDSTPSGDQSIARDLMNYFQNHGHEVEVLSHLRTHRKLSSFRGRVEILLALFPALLKAWLKNPDCFFTYHTYYKAPDIIGSICARILRKPYFIFEGMYSTLPAKDSKFSLGFKLNRFALQTSSHVFCDKTDDLRGLLRLLPAGRVTYLPPSIDLSYFNSTPMDRMNAKRQLDLPDTVPIIASVAMLRPDRKGPGIEFLLHSLARLKANGLQFRHIHVGDGEQGAKLRELAKQLLGSDSTFYGSRSREHVKQCLMAADIFAFPGIDEGFGLVYLEAQAMELPVVAFRNGGVPDAVGDKVGGFLTSPFDLDEHDAALHRLIVDPELRKSMSVQARAWVEARHDLQKNYIQILQTMHAKTSVR